MIRTVQILDTTLREGEQCYGIFFPLDVKKRIAKLLDEVGVDFIEAGHPAAAPSIRNAVAEIAAIGLRARVIAHARMDAEEIRLVKELGLEWVGLFAGISEQSLRRYGLTRDAVYERAGKAVRFARDLGLRIKFTCEDASRTPVHDVIDFYTHLHFLGVDRLSFADTLGLLAARDIEGSMAAIASRMPFTELHFHFHDDFGRAVENAAFAAESGARCIDATILGIGERAGLVNLEHLIAGLNGKYDKEYRLEPLIEATELVGSCINRDRYNKRRTVHKSGIHINGVIKDPATYEPVAPGRPQGERTFVVSKLIGRSGLRTILFRHGFRPDDRDFEALLQSIKSDESLELAGQEEISGYFLERGVERQSIS